MVGEILANHHISHHLHLIQVLNPGFGSESRRWLGRAEPVRFPAEEHDLGL